MKEYGVKIKGIELSVSNTSAKNKITASTRPVYMFKHNKADYIPFLTENGVDLPIKYTRVITSNFISIEKQEFVKDEEIITYNDELEYQKTIHFIIEEL